MRREGECATLRLTRRGRVVAWTVSTALVISIAHRGAAQQEGDAASNAPAVRAGDEPAVGKTQDYEVLRKLLGVPSPAAAPEPQPVSVPPTPRDDREPETEPQAAPVGKRAPAPVKKAAPRARPLPKAAVVQAPQAPQAPQVSEDQPPPPAEAAAPGEAPTAATKFAPSLVEEASAATDIPSPGTILHAADIERYGRLLGPSVQWALLRGAQIRVGPRKPIVMEEARAAATQRYHDQVELTPDRKDMRNYVAGIPFPLVKGDDPDAGVKVIFNQQSRLIVDDVDARKSGCHLASISSKGLELERTFQVEHWRRLFYVGRLYRQPAPTWRNLEDIRYRELQYPLIEPFDLKGGGWDYIRYQGTARSDDGWIYYPVTRRVRRISTAQRSSGFFGQDMDLDSLTGYAGNPAWMQWRLVGEKTILAPMHAEHQPVKWQAPPADFEADEPWEPREVFVVEGRSLLPEYAFARRVVYVDKESWLIPYSEIYDNQGKLWKALHQVWGFGEKVRADAGGRTFEEFYLPGYAMIDMQINHITRCELPLSTAVGEKGWYYDYGDSEGTTEAAFDIVSLVGQNH